MAGVILVQFQQGYDVDYDVFKGLSNPCPPVLNNVVRKLSDSMKDGFVRAFLVRGWRGIRIGIGKERIIKYAAKIAAEARLFDVLIWVTGLGDGSKLKQLQRCIADKLPIPACSTGDDDDGDDAEDAGADDGVDQVVADKVRACLMNRKILLVHDGSWELQDLIQIGIPNVKTGTLVLVASADRTRRYHEVVSMDIADLAETEASQLLWEESVDISEALSLRKCDITPNKVMDCIIYLSLLTGEKVKKRSLLLCWLALGYIGNPHLHLDTTFNAGHVLLQQLQHHGILELGPNHVHVPSYGPRRSDGYNVIDLIFRLKQQCASVRSGTLVPSESLPSENKKSPWMKFSNVDFPEDSFHKRIKNACVLILEKTHIENIDFPKDSTLRFLSLRNCRLLANLPSLDVLEKLEVLDLSKTQMKMPDDSFKSLHNLRFLNLSKCDGIYSLPSSISFLANLEVLLLGSCRNLGVLPSCVLPLEKLQVLDLSNTLLTEIPNNFFQHMCMLKDLNLSSNFSLKSLPASMFRLVNLTKLNLDGYTSSTIIPSFRYLSSLEELAFPQCSSSEDTNQSFSLVKDISNLRVLSLNKTNTTFLSLQACSNLEAILFGANMRLEVLDLSGTKISKFPLEGHAIEGLRCLYLLGVNKLRSVDWKTIHWLPRLVKWEQFGDGRESQLALPKWCSRSENEGVFISVESFNIFKSLTASSPLWNKGLSRFVICVRRGMESRKGKALPPTASSYANMYTKPIKPCVPDYDRCLEIGGGKWFPKGILGVLSKTNFLYMHDEWNAVRLSDLEVENVDDLKECWIERCHNMRVIFDTHYSGESKRTLSLEKLWISNLKKLAFMCRFGSPMARSFTHLKYLQIEYCPRLVKIFSHGACLENLQELEIKFCARLEEIFSGEFHEPKSFQRLHTLLLVELPSLKSIARNVEFASLEKIEIKGCRKLQKIPVPRNRNNST